MHHSSIEPLEARIAPAKLVGSLLTYTDFDGDKVAVTFTLPAGVSALTAANFAAGFVNGNNTTKEALTLVDLTGKTGVGLVLVATPNAGLGDGFANVGNLKAPGTDLGVVSIDGDLAAADLGDADAVKPGVKSLTVHSMGVSAAALGIVAIKNSGAILVKGDIAAARLDETGNVPSITVNGSLLGGSVANGAKILITNGTVALLKIGHDVIGGSADESGKINVTNGGIGSLTIGGSVIGGTDGVADMTAQIQAGDIGPVKIGGDLVGRSANYGGALVSIGALGDVTIGGSVIGGTADHTGYIKRSGGGGFIKIGGELRGGSADFTGSIRSDAPVTTLSIGKSVIGGSVNLTDAQILVNGTTGAFSIGGDLKGGAGARTGFVNLVDTTTSLTIGGSVLGGSAASSGHLGTKGVTMLKITHDLRGGSADAAGTIFSQGNLGTVTIGGTVEGGSVTSTQEQIAVFGNVVSMTIGGDLKGGAGTRGGAINVGSLGTLTIGGSVRGGGGADTGTVTVLVDAGKIKIGHDLEGGSADFTGSLNVTKATTSLTIGGSVIGGSAALTGPQISLGKASGPILIGGNLEGGGGANTGVLSVGGFATSVTVGGSLRGGTVSNTGILSLLAGGGPVKITHDLLGGSNSGNGVINFTGIVEAGGPLASLTIGGSIIAGLNTGGGFLGESGAVSVFGVLSALNVKGDIVGNATTTLRINATGTGAGPAIKTMTIGGSVTRAQLLGGYDVNAGTIDTAAGFGPILIGGDLIASSILAGGNAGNDNNIATADDDFTTSTAKIASITVKGTITGTSGGADIFLLGAGILGPVKFGKGTLKLTAGADLITFGSTGDVLAKDHA